MKAGYFKVIKIRFVTVLPSRVQWARQALSSDAQKGLQIAPDYRPLTAWDTVERRQA
jgi:hypothetical protein